MNTYTRFNIATMQLIIDALNCLPESYALRNEGIKDITMVGDKLTHISFMAMGMTLVQIPALEREGWMIDGSDGVWIVPQA